MKISYNSWSLLEDASRDQRNRDAAWDAYGPHIMKRVNFESQPHHHYLAVVPYDDKRQPMFIHHLEDHPEATRAQQWALYQTSPHAYFNARGGMREHLVKPFIQERTTH